jgi:hypothetical protein
VSEFSVSENSILAKGKYSEAYWFTSASLAQVAKFCSVLPRAVICPTATFTGALGGTSEGTEAVSASLQSGVEKEACGTSHT